MVGENAARLDLYPPFHRKHPTFSIALLKKDESEVEIPRFATRRQLAAAPPPTALENEVHEEDEIAFIMDERLRRTPDNETFREYKVRWTNYSSANDLWVRDDRLKAPNRIRDFRLERRNVEKGLSPLSDPKGRTSEAKSTPRTQASLQRDTSRDVDNTDDGTEWNIERIVGEREDKDGPPGTK
jgi:hypothetical protein